MKHLYSTKRKIAVLTIVFVGLIGVLSSAIYFRAEARKGQSNLSAQPQNERDTAIETALYTGAEFFGAEAIVPFPTDEARTRLAALLEKYPNEPAIFLKLSELDEKLNRYDESEREINVFVELNSRNQSSLESLAGYFHRRAQFEAEAQTLERLLATSKQTNRREIFEELIELAKTHKLEKYLKPDFYREIIRQDPSCFAVVEQFIDKLVEEKNYPEALATLRDYHRSFPNQDGLLEKEIEILLQMKNLPEAEAVYHRAFNPFWSREQTEKYYTFLSDHDRYRPYESELSERFKRNPADFEAAIRLFHFRNYDNEAAPEIFEKLEKIRAMQKIAWQPEELLTVARLLIKAGDQDAASRFLYTLLTQNKLEKAGDEQRAKILYQLFKILSDAGEQRIALTGGDLKFYREVATADSHPGMTTGILSLIFADANASKKLAEKESTANKLFNRDAAYRIFQIYRTQHSATSPELGQMYLDIVRLYAATGETEIAAKTLAEFEQRREFNAERAKTQTYPIVALKLADAYIAAKNFERERRIYQNILDYLGEKQTAAGRPLVSDGSDSSEPTTVKPAVENYPPASNPGISIPAKVKSIKAKDDEDNGLSRSDEDVFESKRSEITYSEVLNRFIASLNRENKTPEILQLYAAEIKKYPAESGLDEQLLQWLGQTNLVEEQLQVYRQAIDKFQGATWRDRLARWFLRRDRNQDFERFSRDLIEKLDDAETENYLAQFVDGKISAKPETFDSQLYLALYERAHQRFPHNIGFVRGLLKFYKAHNQETEWRRLAAQYYFESSVIREIFLTDLAAHNQLRQMQKQASEKLTSGSGEALSLSLLPYKLFRADAAAALSNYEDAVDAYRELNSLYPNSPEYAERLIALTRSFGQINRKFLNESAVLARAQADSAPAVQEYRTRAGEIQAELGDYPAARREWQKLIQTGAGEPETYLETATVFWDYFQYDDALRTIQNLRAQTRDNTIYAFESAAILEAKHNLPGALSEYVKALDGSTPDAPDVVSSDRAKRRLEKLYNRRSVRALLQKAFAQELSRRTDKSSLVLGYADFLRRVKNWKTAQIILKTEIVRSKSDDFLLETEELSDIAEDSITKNLALSRLSETAQTKRLSIKYRFQLAENLNNLHKSEQAALVVRQLVQKFPTNYGVISKADDFYWHINRRAEAERVLQTSLKLAKSDYLVLLGRKLAARYLEQNNNQAAELILQKLYTENPLDSGVYDELTKIYVRTKNRSALELIFKQALAQINKQEIDFREIKDNVTDLRTRLIAALTSLKDYRAAINQHIEIINRDPDDEEKLAAAIDYVKRYGGADVLADYYRKVAAESYKNYRWFVVLARIYEAGNDDSRAIENYLAAINNQPEKPELYDALAKIYERQKNYPAAIENLNKTLQLSGDDPVYLRRIIEVFLKAGRASEAAAARQKLPVEKAAELSIADQFAAASRLQNTEREKAIEISRTAFAEIVRDPFANEIKSADVTTYVNVVRQAEPLDTIAQKLWTLRDKLILESEKSDSTNAGKARANRQTLDGAMTEAVGSVARNYATETERRELFSDLRARIEKVIGTTDSQETVPLLQNLSRKAGFGVLEEQILVGKKDAALAAGNNSEFHNQLNYLLAFYRERANYERVLELLETSWEKDSDAGHFGYAQQIAETARITENRQKEISALRDYFADRSKTLCADCLQTQPDALIARYFDVLLETGDAGKNELRDLSRNHSQFQLQLINFLLAKEEKELAHTAIENSQFSNLWKQARQAQTSLALNEYAEKDADYFLAALQLKSIGELVREKQDAATQLAGDDWFRAADIYGKWLDQKNPRETEKAALFLPAMIENRPHDAGAQATLGRLFLERKENARAIEHLQLSLELEPNNKPVIADLGTAYFQSSDNGKAQEYWAKIIAGDKPGFAEFALYLETLKKNGQATNAREKLAALVVKRLGKFGARSAENLSGEDREDFETVEKEIRLLTDSFGDHEKDPSVARAESDFFLKLSKTVKENTLLPEFLISGTLINRSELVPFYDLLIAQATDNSGSDDKFTELLKTTPDVSAAQNLLAQQERDKTAEPEGNKIKWQRARLELLLSQNQATIARQAIAIVEKQIERRFARPAWLRLAAWRLQIRSGKTAQTLGELKQFVGVTVSPDAPKIPQPNLERLNDAVNLLREENQKAAADELEQSFYWRRLALEQFDAATFNSLAAAAFKRGEAGLGIKLLQIMTDLTVDTSKQAAASELAAIELIKNHAADSTKLEDVPPTNSLNRADALKIAAETAGNFEQFEAAIDFRQKLRAVAPNDEVNRLELARLFAAKQNWGESLKILSEIINDRLSHRNRRWQAVLVAAEICRESPDLWASLKNLLPNLAANDADLWTAVNALELNQTGRADEARELLKPTADNAFLQFLSASFAKQNAEPKAAALTKFLAALNADKTAEFDDVFGFAADDPQSEIIGLYAETGHTVAALQLAEADANLNSPNVGLPAGGYQTLTARAATRKAQAKLRLLKQLSLAAEQIGDFAHAIKFEKGRENLLTDESERQEIRTRIEFLLKREKEIADAGPAINLTVDQKNFSE